MNKFIVSEDLSNIRWGFQKAIEIQSGITSVEDVLKEQASKSQPVINPINTEGDINA